MVTKLEFGQLANYTLPGSQTVDKRVDQMEMSPELRTRVREYLEQQGYTVTEKANLVGKSGIEHTFDMLARRDDGFTSYNVAIGIASGSDSNGRADSIFGLANKAYDCGILDRILVAVPDVSEQMKQLALKQRIKVIGGEQLGEVAAVKSGLPVKPEEPARFSTKDELVKSLTN